MTRPVPLWRAMTEADLAQAARIAVAVYPGHLERPEVMAERLRLFPAGCLVAEDATGHLAGYAVAHPARLGHPPALDSLLGPPSGDETDLHVHDVALAPGFRRGGLGRRGLRHLVEAARGAGLAHMSLVAVGDAGPYWHHMGFRDAPVADGGVALATYGTGARYMTTTPAAVAMRLAAL